MNFRKGQRVLLAAGALLVASGAVHTLIWCVDGTSLDGPVSWRKPILFGFSAGVTLLSMGWLAGKFPQRRGDWLLLPIFGIAMVAEVGLITLQTWRAVPSHFNRATAFDATILFGIESLIVFATVVIAELTRRSFGTVHAPKDMTLAIRGGMILLLFSCLLGFVLVAYGNARTAEGLRPDIYGKAGVMKFPHGMPMHAIQYLPILAWGLRRLSVPTTLRRRVVALALTSLVLFTAFSLLQTFQGRARFDLSLGSAMTLLLSASTAAVALGLAAWNLCSARLQASWSRGDTRRRSH